MKKIRLNNSIIAYEFEELIPYKTYVYVILKNDTAYIIDTFCGSFYMEAIKQEYQQYSFVVINTHYHFDHIWGNIAFQNSPIYAQDHCLDKIQMYAEKEINEYKEYWKGKQELLLPNHTFTTSLSLGNDLYLLYTPGHTLDSISVIDSKNKMIFVGDNLEKPEVQFEKELIPIFIKTLENYLSYTSYTFHSGHTLQLNFDDIKNTILYLKKSTY